MVANALNYFLPYQQRWIDETAQVAIAEKSRRIGFTYAESYRSAERRIKLGTDHLFASRTKETSAEFIGYCKMWARVFQVVAEDLGEQVIDRESDLKAHVLRFANGARILALSSHPDAFRGFGGDVTLDELAFHKDQRGVLKAARASAIIWGHTVRIISTHNGEGSFYNQLILEVRAGKRRWALHRVTLQEAVDEGLVEVIKASRATDPEERQRLLADVDLDARQAFIDQVRSECVTAEEWTEEYCCIPNTDASAYLTYELIDGCTDPALRLHASIADLPHGEGISYYAGYDIGRRRDLSALWVWQIVGDVYWLRLLQELTGEDRKWSSQERLLDTLMARPDVTRLCGDQTGMGEQLIEQRIDKWGDHRVEGVLLTAPRKVALAGPFKGLFEDRRCRIPQHDALREDLHKTRKLVTAGGNVRLHAESDEDGHADRFWAGALATEAASSPANYGAVRV